MFSLSWCEIVAVLIVALLLYNLFLTIYRLYLSPLAAFPGLKVAALTMWHDFYFNVIRNGQLMFEIQKMHEKYGPIVRINPHELHISDPDFYDEIYASAAKPRDKYSWFYNPTMAADSTFLTLPHEHHQVRRAAVNPFFSRRSVTQLEPAIWEKVDKLCMRLRGRIATDEPVNSIFAYMALATDIITQYCFARSYDYLETDDFSPAWHRMVSATGPLGSLVRHFSWLGHIIMSILDWAVLRLNPGLGLFFDMQQGITEQTRTVLQDATPLSDESRLHRTIFHDIKHSSLPPHEKSARRLGEEARVLVNAAGPTIADTLSVTTFHLLSNPATLAQLRVELETAMPDPSMHLSWLQLEKLPYLNAVIHEGLRLANSVVSRLPRISRRPVRYKEFIIPAGTPMSTSSWAIHQNAEIFPEPTVFRPERWIEAAEKGVQLDKYFVPFSRGSRSCLGINLAYAELYMTIIAVFRRFDMELYETEYDRDVRIQRDWFTPAPGKDSRGIRVRILCEVGA